MDESGITLAIEVESVGFFVSGAETGTAAEWGYRLSGTATKALSKYEWTNHIKHWATQPAPIVVEVVAPKGWATRVASAYDGQWKGAHDADFVKELKSRATTSAGLLWFVPKTSEQQESLHLVLRLPDDSLHHTPDVLSSCLEGRSPKPRIAVRLSGFGDSEYDPERISAAWSVLTYQERPLPVARFDLNVGSVEV